MIIETNIRFEIGGVTITQTIDRGEKPQTDGTSKTAEPVKSKEAAAKAETVPQFSPPVEAPPLPGLPKVLVVPPKNDKGGGEPSRTDTGGGDPGRTDTGGGGLLSGGLIVVFGSLIVDCNSSQNATPLSRRQLDTDGIKNNQAKPEPINLEQKKP